MKKALKIAARLEEVSQKKKSDISVIKNENRILFFNNENSNLIELIQMIMIFGPWLAVYFFGIKIKLVLIIALLAYSLIMTFSYFFDEYRYDNYVEINIEEGTLKITKKSFLGKFLSSDQIVKTKKSNRILKREDGSSTRYSLTLETEKKRIPLLKCRDHLDQIKLVFELLSKSEKK